MTLVLNLIGFHAKYEFQEILTLREYLESIRDLDVYTNIELKTNIFKYEGIRREGMGLNQGVSFGRKNHDIFVQSS